MTICCITSSTDDATSTSIVEIKNFQLTKKEKNKLTPCSSTQNLSENSQTPEKSEPVVVAPAWKCCWTTCAINAKNVDALYDHVIEVHIRPKLDEKHAEEVDEVCCEWEDCEMTIERGSIKKKIEWLEQHFRTRHSLGARTFKCVFEECDGRATTSRQLEEHVRVAHLGSPKKQRTLRRSESSSNICQLNKPKNVFTVKDMKYLRNDRQRSALWTDADSNRMIARNILHWYDGVNVKYEKVEDQNEPRLTGAAKRKTSYKKAWRPTYKIVAVEEKTTKEEEVKKEPVEDAPTMLQEKSIKEITLKDLFPRLYEERDEDNEEEVFTPVQVKTEELLPEKENKFILEREEEEEDEDLIDLPPPPLLSPPTTSGETSEDEDDEYVKLDEEDIPPMPFLCRSDLPNSNILEMEMKEMTRRRKMEELDEEPLQKRQRRSLPYGVFEEDESDNEDDYGFERIPEELLKRPPTIYAQIDASGVFKHHTTEICKKKTYIRIAH